MATTEKQFSYFSHSMYILINANIHASILKINRSNVVFMGISFTLDLGVYPFAPSTVEARAAIGSNVSTGCLS